VCLGSKTYDVWFFVVGFTRHRDTICQHQHNRHQIISCCLCCWRQVSLLLLLLLLAAVPLTEYGGEAAQFHLQGAAGIAGTGCSSVPAAGTTTVNVCRQQEADAIAVQDRCRDQGKAGLI